MHDRELTEALYRSLRLIRRVEEEVARIYPSDKIKSPVHLSIGQEAASVGVCSALEPDDVVYGTYRGHALYLAKGGDLQAMVAELYGKATGCTRGKGGSMHLIDTAANVMGTSAVVGTTVPHAAGHALALKQRGTGHVVACFFGDGAMEEGVFHETMNFAALRKLPVLFVCENNQYAIHSPLDTRHANTDLCARASSYGMPVDRVADGDVFRVRELAVRAIDAMRGTDAGPAFIEVVAYRWKEHVGPGEDYEAGYRSREEAQPWYDRDPVLLLGAQLDNAVREAVDAEVEAAVADAIRFAEDSPFPDDAELMTQVFDEAAPEDG